MFGFLKRNKKKKEEPTPTPLEVGAKIYQLDVNSPPILADRPIIEMVGQGKILEDQGKYEEAIMCFEKAEDLTWELCGADIRELQARHPQRPPDWDWLYLKMIRRRIRVCKKAIKRRDG